jgi:hypothetical protein
MKDWLRQSPETTLCGLGALVGLMVMLMGLAFGKDEVWKTGMAIVGAAATLMGFLARSQRQHEVDKPALKVEVIEEARGIARSEAQQTVEDVSRGR